MHLPDDKASAFVRAVGDVAETETDNKKHLLATKDDIQALKGDIHTLELDIHTLELTVERSKGHIYKAVFWTGIVQLMAILGGVLAIVKYMR